MSEATVVRLNDKYTFDNYVVGDCNSFAHAVAWQIATNSGKSYNPLFIHAKPGLGKTHLTQAIGHEFLKAHPGFPMVYCTAEAYLNEVVSAIREDTTAELRRKYRRVKLWLIDDVRFFWDVNAPVTEEEFFHTLGHLLNNHGQVVMCSDAPPKELPILNPRLRGLMQAGILVDLRMPEFETRVKILEKKLETAEGTVTSAIVEYLARKVDSNIRILEGTLLKLCANQVLYGHELTPVIVDEVIADYTTTYDRVIPPEEIVEIVSERFNIAIGDLLGYANEKRINLARQVAICLTRRLASLSLEQIGGFFGGRPNQTIFYSLKRLDAVMGSDQELGEQVHQMEQELRERRP